MTEPLAVLFVCLGNICRSPMAQAVLVHRLRENEVFSVHVDSCGTGAYHEGNAPDPRTLATLEKHGIQFKHEARQLSKKDFDRFHYILALDRENLVHVQRVAPKDCKATICLFGDYSLSSEPKIVKDPYYGEDDGFEKAYDNLTAWTFLM